MPLSVDQFVRRLVDSELFTRKELNDFVAALKPRPQDGEELAKALVRAHKLTRFQVKRAYAGEGGPLVLGNYAILDKIGAGGMGEVYLAEHRRMGRKAALKILPAKVADDEQAVRRFHREVQAVAKLSHPNIVAAFDAGESKGTHYFVMEYAAGQDLSSIVKANGPLAANDAIECIQQAAAGLAYAHEQGVVHRDIKPSNLLLASGGREPADGVDERTTQLAGLRPMLADGTVKVLDLGLARFEQGEHDQTQTELTSTGAVMGTVDYMAPEQAMNTKNADARSDIYSLGCALFYLLTGRAPYAGETVIEKIFAHQNSPIPSISKASIGRQPADDLDDITTQSAGIRPMLANLQPIFEKMVAKNPDDRFQSMNEIVAALQQVKSGAMATATADTTTGTDVELRQFLDGIDQPETKTFIETPIEPPQPQTPETEATVNVPQETISSGLESMSLGLTKRPKKTWGDYLRDRNLQIFGGGAVLVLIVAVALGVLMNGKDNDGRSPDKTPSDDSPSESSNRFVLQFDGKDDYVTIRSLRRAGKSPITIEAIVSGYRPDRKQSLMRMTASGGIIEIGHDAGSSTGWNAQVYLRRPDSVQSRFGPAPANDAPVHVACVWSGSRLRLFINGIEATGVARTKSATGGNRSDLRRAKREATFGTILGGYRKSGFFTGRLHALRVSETARYTRNFTPEQRFKHDVYTLALYRCDEGRGTRLTDSSGRKHHGVIHGATWVKEVEVPAKAKSSPADDLNRRVAKWARRVGDATLSIFAKAGGKHVRILPNEPLPNEAFDIAEITLNNSKPIEDADLRRLAELKRLRKIVIDKATAPLPWNALESLPQVEELWLMNAGFNEADLPHLARMAKLNSLTLELSGQRISKAFMTQLGNIERLHSLGIRNAILDRGALNSFARLAKLRILSLKKVSIGDNFQALDKANTLNQLVLNECGVTDAGVKYIGALPQLYDLRLTNNKGVTDAGLAELANLPKLGILDLSGTSVTREAALTFKRRHPSTNVHWNDKPLNIAAGSSVPNYALQFDGKDDYVALPNSLKYDGKTPLTIEAWLTRHKQVTGPGNNLVSNAYKTGDRWHGISISTSDRQMKWHGTIGTSDGTSFVESALSESGKTVHIALVYTGRQLRLYLDGKLKAKSDISNPMRPSSRAFFIGCIPETVAGSRYHLAGTIAELRFSQLARYDKNFTPDLHFSPDKHTLALYHFDEGQGNKLIDSSGNNHHGVIHGATWVKP